MTPVYDAVTAMGAGTTGRGRLSDLVADTGASAIALSPAARAAVHARPARRVARARPSPWPPGSINADLGVRVIACSFGSFDLHDGHSWGYPQLIAAARRRHRRLLHHPVAPRSGTGWRSRPSPSSAGPPGPTAPAAPTTAPPRCSSSSATTCKGGLYGAQPRLDDLTADGDLKVQVDFRSVYASIIDGWLGGGSSTVLGGEYEDLDLFRARPGGGSIAPTAGVGPLDAVRRPGHPRAPAVPRLPRPARRRRRRHLLGEQADRRPHASRG